MYYDYDSDYIGLGLSISANFFSDTLNTIIANQQAKIGRFLTYKQKLQELKSRAIAIQSVDNQAGTILLGKVNALIDNQTTYEKQGIDLLTKASAFMSNPIIQAISGSPNYMTQASGEMTLRISDLYSQVSELYNLSKVFSSNVSKHESNITDLEKNIISKENDLTGRGILRQIQKPAQDIMSTLKTIAIAGAIIFGASMIMKVQRGSK